MSSRIFQSVVLQMKDCTERPVGVIDDQGTIVACNELTCIGEKYPAAAAAVSSAEVPSIIFKITCLTVISRFLHHELQELNENKNPPISQYLHSSKLLFV